jgi:hypothetical protein
LLPSDAATVTTQLGRPPRGDWRVVARCSHGFPMVIAVAPDLGDGTLFPTTFWLTCPLAVAEVHRLESEGAHGEWAEKAEHDPHVAELMVAADAAYRAARALEGSGVDPCPHVGCAGQRDPLQVKCLHARVAGYLAGVGDPIGQAITGDIAERLHDCDGAPCGGGGTEHGGASAARYGAAR